MTTTQIKNRGFTLVELLIVIVIIAILTVVSLVAYNGLQNKAKTTAAESAAETVGKKAELYNADKGSYPEKLEQMNGSTVSRSETFHIAADVLAAGSGDGARTTLTSAPENANTIKYEVCPDKKGAKIHYWDYTAAAGSNVKTRVVGVC